MGTRWMPRTFTRPQAPHSTFAALLQLVRPHVRRVTWMGDAILASVDGRIEYQELYFDGDREVCCNRVQGRKEVLK
jgi:hypothetical protein